MADPSQGKGQGDKDREYSVQVHDAQGTQVGDHGRQTNFFTYVGSTGTDGSARRSRPAFTGKVESPYRGLLAFGEQDAPFFFGQDAAAEEILSRLRVRAEAPALMIVSGVSGSGKSSLLRAGVLPYLGEIAPEGSSWPHLTLTPARSPLSELAACTAGRTGKDAATLLQTLRDDPAQFALAALEAAGTPEDGGARGRLVLVVDQFEQVFTQCPDENERRAFITALHAAATVGHGDRQIPAAMVILIVRADFVETRCADYEELVEAIQNNRYFLPPMSERQLRLAITEPARVAGTAVDDALVSKLIETIRDTSSRGTPEATALGTGVLPHLSHALDQAWRHRAGNLLTLDDYERAGGIEGSIGASADHAHKRLTPAQQATARQVFTRLVATTDSGTDTGDRASIAELTEGKDPAGTADVHVVLEAFAAQRLLTLTSDSVELSHEALLTAWPKLDEWLTDTRADRIVRTQLRTAASRWDEHDRNPSYLYRGTQLAALQDASARWSADPARHPALTGTERDFLDAANRSARRATLQRRAIAAALAILLVASLIATGIAVNAAGTARQQTAIAASGQLATQSEALDGSAPATASLLAAASWRIDQNNPQARVSLLNAYAQPDHATLNVGDGLVHDVAYSRDGKMLATADSDGTVRLWNAATHARIGTPIIIPGTRINNSEVEGVAFSPNGQTLAIVESDRTVRLWDVATRAQVGAPIISPGGSSSNAVFIIGVAFSPNGQALATIGTDGAVRFWDVDTRAQIGRPIMIPGRYGSGGSGWIAFSPNGQSLATAGSDGAVRFWDVATRTQHGAAIAVPGGAVNGVAFSPNGQTLATIGSDRTVRLWNVATRAQLGTPIAVPGNGEGAAFSPNGQTLATGGSYGTAHLWDVALYNQIGASIPIPNGTFTQGVFGVAFSQNGKVLASAGSDGKVRLWSVVTRARIGVPITIPGSFNLGVSGVAFSRNGQTLATAGGDGMARFWNIKTFTQSSPPIAVAGSSSTGVKGVAFSPNGQTLATVGGDDGKVRLWDVAARAQIGPVFATPRNSPEDGGVAFSPNGQILATAGADGMVRLWDVATRAQIGPPITIPGSVSSDQVSGVAFSPDGKLIAVAGGDGMVRLWDVATRAQIGSPISFPGSTSGNGIDGVAFSPNGQTLATAGYDGMVRLWDVAFPVNLVEAVCDIAGRSLTRQEWKTYVPSEPFQQVCPER